MTRRCILHNTSRGLSAIAEFLLRNYCFDDILTASLSTWTLFRNQMFILDATLIHNFHRRIFLEENWKESALCGDANPRRLTRSSPWINIGNGKGSSLWVRRQSKNKQASGTCARDPWPFEPKINIRFDTVSRATAVQIIPIRGFRFIVLTYTPT